MLPLISLPIFGNKFKLFWKCNDCGNNRMNKMNAWNMDMEAVERVRKE